MKKISLIVPVYNAEKYLNRLWCSIKKQTIYDRLEIIFINDGSTDNTIEILKEIKKERNDVIIRNISNNGVSNARNLGIEMSSEEYILFVDSDDYIEKDYCELFYNQLENEFDLIVTGNCIEYEKQKVYNAPKDAKIVSNELIIKNFLMGQIDFCSTNKLFKKEIIGNLRFNVNYSIAEDKLFVYEYLKKCNSALLINECKYYYVQNSMSAMNDAFDDKKLKALKVSQNILKDIQKNYSQFKDITESFDIDTKVRVYCEIYKYKRINEYKKEYCELKKQIKQYDIIKKYKTSTKKHFFSFILARIHPKLYIFFRDNLRLQYK